MINRYCKNKFLTWKVKMKWNYIGIIYRSLNMRLIYAFCSIKPKNSKSLFLLINFFLFIQGWHLWTFNCPTYLSITLWKSNKPRDESENNIHMYHMLSLFDLIELFWLKLKRLKKIAWVQSHHLQGKFKVHIGGKVNLRQ